MKKFVAIVLFVLAAAPAIAVTITPIVTRNSYVNTTAEVISSSGGTACTQLIICNTSETAGRNAFVSNSSGVSVSTGIMLYPSAATAAGGNCLALRPGDPKGKNEPNTIDATAWYAVAETGTVTLSMVCVP